MNDPRETLNRIRKQADNATKGPWVCTLNGDESEVTYANAPITWDDHGGEVFTEGDAEFIAAARTTVPALVDALEKVLELHPREVVMHADPEFGQMEDDAICSACIVNHDAAPWPCPDVRAITTALETIK